MSASVHGIHHVTVIAGDPVENLDFYIRVLGMRLVKKSINQDVPDTYHLFYADGAGTPGSDLTFFPWPKMRPSRPGVGLMVEVPLAVPAGSLPYWKDRFEQEGVTFRTVETRFGEQTLPFSDPHGLQLALVETGDERAFTAWGRSPVPEAHQIRGMHAVRLWESELEPTETVLTELLGFSKIGEEEGWHRYGVDGGRSGQIVEVAVRPGEPQGTWGTGGVHHVAWRVADSEEEMALRVRVGEMGLGPSPQIDRFWFKSVYFREPGGTLFELATDGPGFGRDEDMETLGEKLILPPWMERQRAAIEAALPPLEVPQFQSGHRI